MNGFANAILTLLLSWMRVLVNDLWRLLSSEDAGLFYRFLAANWKVIVLILCAGGFVIDRIIYLIRWRPYYVWSSRLGRLKRARAARHGDVYPKEDAIPPEEEPSASPDGQEVLFPDDSASYAPGAFDQAYPQDFGATRAYAPAQDFAPSSQAPAMNQATVQYAPLEQGPLYAPYSQPYQPPQDLDPVFDETEERWEEGDALVRPLWDNPAEGMDSSFGAPRPEPIQSIRDMQAGFAPPRPPEELYAPPPAPPAPPPAAEARPVHPGLDAAEFRERLGLTQPTPLSSAEEENVDTPEAQPAMKPPVFHPFTMRTGAQAPTSGGSALRRLAKKARDLVGVDDEDHRPTIHDLQSTVDVTQAFHEPVYPRPRDQQGGEK